ncbi:uncharacterized protein LOC123537160 isoform X1 [Mercenaria mercenaria]|uniref:uncharacterized protein LOC123537160 isoform X1 n=1 Tax=Mercenaria mercenaria TaxID=6596 RepID=UPI00234EFDA5|nr:uncharacterized protein LOC123537160 isoform X1 [Mercenaria mercenaria]
MPVRRDRKRENMHPFNNKNLRGRMLQSLHSRAMLIFVCTLVILECLCVMAELMVDLHGIRVRFDHEEQELNLFIQTLKAENGDCSTDPTSLGDVLDFVINAHSNSRNTTRCHVRKVKNSESINKLGDNNNIQRRRRRFIYDFIAHNDNKHQKIGDDYSVRNYKSFKKRRSTKEGERKKTDPSLFVFSLHVDKDNYLVISTFDELTKSAFQQTNWSTYSSKYIGYKEENEKIQTVSHTIKYIGFSILSMMVIETLLKMLCLGCVFFRKKIEVFDAVIVLVSFFLDVMFIDSNWYESGKDATSILVLLLPWRIVRIINSFVMTINRKHYIQLMTIKRSKKKIVLKLKKLRHLMLEMRRDIDLLITLSKAKGASDTEIFNCIYGKGRGTKSLTAITSFASLMFISTLGKDPSNKSNCDDMYGELIRDILGDDEEDEDDTELEKTLTDTSNEKDSYTDIQRVNTEESFIIPKVNKRKTTPAIKSLKSDAKITRRVTLPRRHKSCSDEENSVFYVNDAYDVDEDLNSSIPPLYKYRRDVQSLPHICSSVRGKNYVTFEVTTQVTYL